MGIKHKSSVQADEAEAAGPNEQVTEENPESQGGPVNDSQEIMDGKMTSAARMAMPIKITSLARACYRGQPDARQIVISFEGKER